MMTRKTRFLVVDDEPSIREIVEYQIKAVYGGCEVFLDWNGKNALQTVNNKEGKFDIVITNIHMPEVTGIELTRRVKRLFPKIKIIIMSAMHDKREEALASGADAFLEKPFGLKQLVETMQRLLQ